MKTNLASFIDLLTINIVELALQITYQNRKWHKDGWNILDATMASAPSGQSGVFWQTGYVRELQIRRMVELAQRLPTERPVHYCEIGMNGGHSAVSMLLAHPNLTAHVFDPLEYDYSAPVVKLLTDSFQEP